MGTLLRCPSLKKQSKKEICHNVVEVKEVGFVPLLILMLFSALEKEGVNGEGLANAGQKISFQCSFRIVVNKSDSVTGILSYFNRALLISIKITQVRLAGLGLIPFLYLFSY